MDVIKKIEEAKNNLISVEDTLNLLMKTYDCSIEYAAEILLAILPEEKKITEEILLTHLFLVKN